MRVLAATNRDLKREVDAGRYRQDLYYRLNVFPIEVAPLRERREDIPILAEHFLELSAKRLGRPTPRLTRASVLELQIYDWPGNVRELQNVIERAVITATGGVVRLDLPRSETTAELQAVDTSTTGDAPEVLTEAQMRRQQRENIRSGGTGEGLNEILESCWLALGKGEPVGWHKG